MIPILIRYSMLISTGIYQNHISLYIYFYFNIFQNHKFIFNMPGFSSHIFLHKFNNFKYKFLLYLNTHYTVPLVDLNYSKLTLT